MYNVKKIVPVLDYELTDTHTIKQKKKKPERKAKKEKYCKIDNNLIKCIIRFCNGGK